MTLARKLERLMAALSVRERFLVALREYKADLPISVNISDLSAGQRAEYQDYARFVTALNNGLGTYVEAFIRWAEFLESDLEGYVDVLEQAAEQLESEYGIPREAVSQRKLRSDRVSVPAYLRGLAAQLRRQLQGEVDLIWKELRSVETVWSEAEAELGEDPVHPAARERLEAAKRSVSASHARLGRKRKLPEPGDELTERARQLVRESAKLQAIEETS